MLEHLAHAFFNGRDERPRDRSSHHRVDELEARAARQRFDGEPDVPVLPAPTGLFLVLALSLGRSGHGLAVRDLGLGGLHVEVVAVQQARQDEFQV
ncbi:hypothetical protein D3C78_1515060 [compost metagenome]